GGGVGGGARRPAPAPPRGGGGGPRRSAPRIHTAATMSRANAVGPCGLAWLSCSRQPKASSTTRGGHHIFLASSNAAAANTQATKIAHDPVRLKNEPTPPTQGSTQFVSSSSFTPSTCSGLSFGPPGTVGPAAKACVLMMR